MDSLYYHPQLYQALRGPTHEESEALRLILEAHLGRPPSSVMDPACGPGTWLEPFALRSTFVAGNDLSPAMVAAARGLLPGELSEITEGDMRTLNFRRGPFEAAFEMSGAVGMFIDAQSILPLMNSLCRAVVPGGVALLALHFRDSTPVAPLPRVCWSRGPIPMPSGEQASVVYEILREDAKSGIDLVRRSVRVEGPTANLTHIADEYSMKTWSPKEFKEVLAQSPGFSLDAVYRDDGPGWQRSDRGDLVGERLVVLRRVQSSGRNGAVTREPLRT